MNAPLDPIELFALLNPVPDDEALAPTRRYVPAQRTLQRILAEPDVLPPDVAEPAPPARPMAPHRRRWRAVLVVAAVTAAVAGSAAASYIVSRQPSRPDTIVCYAAASLRGDAIQAHAAPDDAVTTCLQEWRSGSFAGFGPVPAGLAACVLPSGVIGVFPGDPSVCDRLQIARLATESDGLTTNVPQIVDQLTSLTSRVCLDASAARQELQRLLDTLGASEWRIVGPTAFPPSRPCASLAFDPPTKTITLVPVPDTVTSTPPGG